MPGRTNEPPDEQVARMRRLMGEHGIPAPAADDAVEALEAEVRSRDMLDAKLSLIEAQMAAREPTRPIVTTLVGSTRFPEAFWVVMMSLTMAGRIVIPPGLYGHADIPTGARYLCNDGDESTPEKQRLDALHYRKIDISDGIYVVNPGLYVGSSTKREINYALENGKTVEYMFDGAEL